MIISQPIFRFLGVIFDEDHDFEGLRSPRAHLDTVLRNLSRHLGTPRRLGAASLLLARYTSAFSHALLYTHRVSIEGSGGGCPSKSTHPTHL